MFNAFPLFVAVTILLMPLFYFLAHFRKGKYMCKIPIAIRYIYYAALCVIWLFAVFWTPFDIWGKLAEKSFILCILVIFIGTATYMDIAYNVLFKRYTWIQRLLEKE